MKIKIKKIEKKLAILGTGDKIILNKSGETRTIIYDFGTGLYNVIDEKGCIYCCWGSLREIVACYCLVSKVLVNGVLYQFDSKGIFEIEKVSEENVEIKAGMMIRRDNENRMIAYNGQYFGSIDSNDGLFACSFIYKRIEDMLKHLYFDWNIMIDDKEYPLFPEENVKNEDFVLRL